MILMNATSIISLAPLVKKINRKLEIKCFDIQNCFLRAHIHKPNLHQQLLV